MGASWRSRTWCPIDAVQRHCLTNVSSTQHRVHFLAVAIRVSRSTCSLLCHLFGADAVRACHLSAAAAGSLAQVFRPTIPEATTQAHSNKINVGRRDITNKIGNGRVAAVRPSFHRFGGPRLLVRFCRGLTWGYSRGRGKCSPGNGQVWNTSCRASEGQHMRSLRRTLLSRLALRQHVSWHSSRWARLLHARPFRSLQNFFLACVSLRSVAAGSDGGSCGGLDACRSC